jgi:hypothetical protein
MRWPWGRKFGVVYLDPRVAAIRDPAAREVVNQCGGLVVELLGRVAALENRQREVTARLQEVQYKEGSTFAANDATAAALVRAHKMGGEGG